MTDDRKPTIYLPSDPLDLLEEALECMKYFHSDGSDLAQSYLYHSTDGFVHGDMSLAARTVIHLNTDDSDLNPFQTVYHNEDEEYRASLLSHPNLGYMPHVYFIDGLVKGRVQDVLDYILYTSRIHESKLPKMVVVYNPKMEEGHETLHNSVMTPIESFKNCLRQAFKGYSPSSLIGMNRYAERFERVRKCLSDYTSYMPCSD